MKTDKTLIIAEIGVNHDNNLKKAFKLISLSKKAGADLVKFQLYKTSDLVSVNHPLANYQKKNLNKKKINQFKLLKDLEINKDFIKKVISYAKQEKIGITFSIFSESLINIFKNKYIDYIKIPSGELINHKLINELNKIGKKIIISTGMSSIKEIKESLKLLNKKKVVLLHCVSEYPTSLEKINLNSIKYLKRLLKVKVGLSDHTTSIHVPSYAVCLGASIIEKHITLDKRSSGPDHKCSLTPNEFKKMVHLVRDTEKALGKNRKLITTEEKKMIKVVRKYIVAKKNIYKGDIFNEKNICLKRISGHLDASYYKKLFGKKAKTNFIINQAIF